MLSFKKRKIFHALIALAVFAGFSLVSFHAHSEPAKASEHCATCLCGTQLRSADPVAPAADVATPVFAHCDLIPVVQASFVVRFSAPRPARAPPIS